MGASERPRGEASSPSATTANSTTSASAARTPASTALIADLDIRVIDRDTGELLRELTLNPARNFQPTRRPPGPTHGSGRQSVADRRHVGAVAVAVDRHGLGVDQVSGGVVQREGDCLRLVITARESLWPGPASWSDRTRASWCRPRRTPPRLGARRPPSPPRHPSAPPWLRPLSLCGESVHAPLSPLLPDGLC